MKAPWRFSRPRPKEPPTGTGLPDGKEMTVPVSPRAPSNGLQQRIRRMV